MAKKKTRRQMPPRRPPQRQVLPPPPAGAATMPQPVRSRESRFVTTSRAAEPTNWAHEYRYVIQDLKRMALTSALMFALLFGLALVVPLFLR
ncbi:MAG: hypothetical protein KKA73_27195 [Chloroflexi bacterium]|nr:hypothetical protein [Chloroflexota bacterium]MBU1751383.1 hypothetical protein [Chloroflexota bacterium]MBU1879566.1 hypothetical protein [Chloroflexota bacterium]